MRILLTASGGGHTGYAVSIAQHLAKKAEIKFVVPEGDKWTISKVENYGEYIEVIKGRGPRDPLYKFMPRLLKSFWQSLFRISGDTDLIISSGSNHSIPPALVGKIRGKKLVNVESSVRFTKASKSAKILSLFSDLTALHWDEQLELFPDGIVVGPIFEEPLFETIDGEYILVTGGTWGFKGLFDVMAMTGIENIVLQTGRLSPQVYKKQHPEWKVFDFDPELGRWIAGAKVVISHLGKTVIDAALTYRKPVIIAVNPEWTRTAGLEDARALAEKTNSVLLDSLTRDSILEAISKVEKKKPPTYKSGGEELVRIILEEFSD